MQTNKQTAGTFPGTTKEGYKVSENAAAILNCLRANNTYYEMIVQTLGKIYGKEKAEEEAKPYFSELNEIASMLKTELIQDVEENITTIENLNSETITI